MIRSLSIVGGIVLSLATVTVVQAQNNKPIRSGNFYEDRAKISTTFYGNPLILTFAQTPSDKFTNVTDVICRGKETPDAVLDDAYLFIGTTSGSNDIDREFGIAGSTFVSSNNAYTYFNINTQTKIKIGPARFPSISLLIKPTSMGAAFSAAQCVIVGELSDN